MLLLAFKVFGALVLSIILYHVYLTIRYYRIVKFTFNACGWWIPLVPFVGNVYVAIFTSGRVNMLSTLNFAEKWFGMPVNFWFGHKYHYMCNDAEEAKIVLTHPKCYDKAQLYSDVQYIFRSSLLLVTSEKWKSRRRFLRAAFKTNMINSFIPVMYSQSSTLIDKIKNMPPNEDLYKFFNRHAFMIFFLTSSGMHENLNPEVERFGSLIDSVQDEFVKLLVNPLIPAYIWTRIPPGAKLRRLHGEMKQLLKKILLDQREQRAQVSEYVADATEVPLVDLLLSDGYEKESESAVFEEFTLFAGAATDTTGHTLAFCFVLLGMYPEIQERVYEEVVSVVGDRVIENANVQGLKYTEAVISETLRIFPTVPLFGRYCTEDIDIGSKIVPKGANVFVSAFHIHRNPEYWPDPLRFDPSRFDPENVTKIIPGSYVPFSYGPRNCIGQAMATILLKITVATVVRHYKITSSHKSIDEFNLESCISMKTDNNLDCKFTPRVPNGH